MKRLIVVVLLLLAILVFVYKDTYSLEEDVFNIEIYDNENMDVLKDEMLYFIDLVDNSIIRNSSFNLSNKLNENYDFLTWFAISFILEYEDEFDVVSGDNSLYKDQYGIDYVSNKYVSIDDIYNITNRVLGVDYYYIMDRDIVIGDKVLLVNLNNPLFNMEIDYISNISRGNGYYDVHVKYIDNEYDYVYRFEKVDNDRLIISNLSIMG